METLQPRKEELLFREGRQLGDLSVVAKSRGQGLKGAHVGFTEQRS